MSHKMLRQFIVKVSVLGYFLLLQIIYLNNLINDIYIYLWVHTIVRGYVCHQ